MAGMDKSPAEFLAGSINQVNDVGRTVWMETENESRFRTP